jgi:predicted MFS family arabinose efflux permease
MFWILSFGLGSIAMLATGLFFHMISIFSDSGFGPTTAAWVYVPIALTTALVNLGSGILVDRIAVRTLLATALLTQAAALIMAQFLITPWLAFTYGIVLGTTLGLMGTINGVAWAKYFGRQYLGSISGVGSTILIVGAALGPMPFGIARDWLGSYSLVLTVAALIPLGLAISCFFIGQPRKPPST